MIITAANLCTKDNKDKFQSLIHYLKVLIK